MIIRAIRRFLDDRRGNILPMFGLSLIPVMGLIGAAVDYSRANAVKSKMQAALDSTALAMAANAASLSAKDLKANATAYFNALYNSTNSVTLDVSYTNKQGEGPRVTVTGQTSVPTQFMNIPGIGINQMPVSATSQTAWGNTRLRVALALDNTGSMAQNNKMTALKTAATNLLTQLQTAANGPEDVYVSIIPFAKDVNVGGPNGDPTWTSPSWIRWSGASDTFDENNGSCSKRDSRNRVITNRSTCVSSSVRGTWTAASHNTWNGCVMDRDQDYDTTNTAPAVPPPSQPDSRFPAEQYSDCPVALTPLTNNWTTLKNKINSMTPTGNTNTTIGLEWAWHSLTQGVPLNAPAEDSQYQYNKVIIFLTDGENTQNRFTSNQTQIDARMKLACTNANNAGISIYTILVLDGSASLLQGCASKPDQYFKITSSNQLVDVFSQIGTKLSRLRVAK